MLIHVVGTGVWPLSLTLSQSRSLLQFCRSGGATLFTVNFVFVQGEESETLMRQFYERLSTFSESKRLLENIGGCSERLPCWVLNEQSIEVILKETGGDLFAYNVPNLPEDWLFYIDDSIFLQIVTHEQEATLRISETDYTRFKELGIPHEPGCPQYSGLPEQPIRTTPR